MKLTVVGDPTEVTVCHCFELPAQWPQDPKQGGLPE
jgi:hypothetical protein